MLSKEIFEYIRPIKDKVFKIIFGKPYNRDILEDFLQAVTGEPVHITNVQTEMYWGGDTLEEKQMRSDMVIETENSCDLLEIQAYHDKEYEARATSYEGKLIIYQLQKIKSYTSLKRMRFISIMDSSHIDMPEFYGKSIRVLEEYKHIPVFNLVEHYIVDIAKFREIKDMDMHNRLHQWAEFLRFDRREVLEMIAKENNKIEKALKEIDRIMGDEETRRKIQSIWEARIDKEIEINTARDIGIEIGEKNGYAIGEQAGIIKGESVGIQKGEKIGFLKGEKSGISKGEKLGLEKARKTHLISMLQAGIADELIMKVMQISKKELQKEKQALEYNR